MKLSLFDYQLPEKLIAQKPEEKRDHSRLLQLDKNFKHEPIDHMFYDIDRILDKDDVIVMNNTKVIPARIFGIKRKTKAHVEMLIIDGFETETIKALTKPARKIEIGDIIDIGSDLYFECIEHAADGVRIYLPHHQGSFIEKLERYGSMPLPPYIKAGLKEKSRYQTIYAKHSGSSAAPTAGLHFTENVLEALKKKGISIVELTLHVGLGTFSTVKKDDITEHKMHEETYIISEKSMKSLNEAKKTNKRIISVGTTSLRALESNYEDGQFHHGTFQTSIFMYPGYHFRAVDGLITNFHLPKSTLLMLVSAFCDRTYLLHAYEHAISKEYRFFSFGDAMIIL